MIVCIRAETEFVLFTLKVDGSSFMLFQVNVFFDCDRGRPPEGAQMPLNAMRKYLAIKNH